MLDVLSRTEKREVTDKFPNFLRTAGYFNLGPYVCHGLYSSMFFICLIELKWVFCSFLKKYREFAKET